MSFNNNKFEVIRFTKHHSEVSYKSATNTHIEQKEVVKDLGILVSENLKFDTHILKTVKSGRQFCGWILRTFLTREPSVLIPLLKILVISRLEYCCPLWSPSDAANIQSLEKVQRDYLKKINTVHHLNYWEKLKELKLYSLERRRERYIIMYVWKAIHNIIPNPGFTIIYNDRTGITLKLPKLNQTTPSWLRKAKNNSITHKGSQLFNILPTSLRQLLNYDDHPKLSNFKNALDKLLNTIPDQPTTVGLQRPAQTNSLVHQMQYR